MNRAFIAVLMCLLLAGEASAQSVPTAPTGSGATCDLSHGLGAPCNLAFAGVRRVFNFVLDNVATAAPHPQQLGNQAMRLVTGVTTFTCTAFGTVTPVNCTLNIHECPGASGGVTGCTSILAADLVLTALNVNVNATVSDTAWASGAFLKPVYVSGTCSEVTSCRLLGETVP